MKNSTAFSLTLLATTIYSAEAASYLRVFDLASVAATPGTELGAENPFLDAVVADGDKAFGLIRINGGGAIVEFDGATGTSRTVLSNTQWGAVSSGNLGGFHGATVAGGDLVFSNTFDNQAYRVNIGTGALTTLATTASMEAVTGGSVNLTAASSFSSAGNGFMFDGTSDSILGVAADGTVSTVVTSLQLATLMGNTTVSMLGASGGDLFIGSNGSDSLYRWDVEVGAGSVVFTTAELEAVTDDVDGRAGFAGFTMGGDGRGYFYENDSDFILSFDPANPTGSLRAELTEDELAAGPAGSDSVGQLTWYDGEVAWTNLREGFFAVPEPSSTLLLGLASLAGLGYRRRLS